MWRWDTSTAGFDALTGHRCPQELPPGEQEACRVFKGVLGKELKAVLQDKLQCGAVGQHTLGCSPQKGGKLIGIEVWGLKSKVLIGRKTFCNGVSQAYNPSRSRDCPSVLGQRPGLMSC